MSRSFWGDTHNDTTDEKEQFVLSHLKTLTTPCHITILQLSHCEMKGENTKRLPGVLIQCPALNELNLHNSGIGSDGARRLVGGLVQCRALAHLDLSCQFQRHCRERETSRFMTWSSHWSCFIGTLYCLLFQDRESKKKKRILFLRRDLALSLSPHRQVVNIPFYIFHLDLALSEII